MEEAEAIKFLKRYVGNPYYTPQCQKAHRMAIEALTEDRREWVARLLRELDAEMPDYTGTDYDIGYHNGLNMAKAIVIRLGGGGDGG